MKFVKLYFSSCLVTGIIMPVIVTIITAESYVNSLVSSNGAVTPAFILQSLLGSAFIALLAWAIIAALYSYFVTPQGANMRSYSLLVNRLEELKTVVTKSADDENKLVDTKKTFYQKAKACCNTISDELQVYGMRWVLGKGYIRMWNLMHRADEALIEFEPPNEVVGDAIYTYGCIKGSKMDSSQDLINKLDAAMQVFDPDAAAKYFQGQPNSNSNSPQPTPPADKLDVKPAKSGIRKYLQAQPNPPQNTNPPQPAPTDKDSEDKDKLNARSVMREVRIALNIYRDDRWEAMVTSRNQLFATVFVTGIITYLLLTVAIMNGVIRQNLIAAMVEYAVGAAAGLFGRLYIESGIDNAVDDYGLAFARLITTPVLSGLAGIGGVLVTVILASQLLITPLPTSSSSTGATPTVAMTVTVGTTATAQSGQLTPKFMYAIPVAPSPTVTTPIPTATPTSGSTPTPTTTPTPSSADVPRPCSEQNKQSQGCYTLADVFLLDPRFIVAAAVFGLTPNLLIQTLQKRATQYSADIFSSQPQNQGSSNA